MTNMDQRIIRQKFFIVAHKDQPDGNPLCKCFQYGRKREPVYLEQPSYHIWQARHPSPSSGCRNNIPERTQWILYYRNS